MVGTRPSTMMIRELEELLRMSPIGLRVIVPLRNLLILRIRCLGLGVLEVRGKGLAWRWKEGIASAFGRL